MSHIMVEFAQLQEIGKECATTAKKIQQAKEDFQSSINKLDWEVKSKANIRGRAVKLSNRITRISLALMRYNSFINKAHKYYSALDSYTKNDEIIEKDKYEETVTKNGFATKKKTTYTEYEKRNIIKDDYGTATITETYNKEVNEQEISPQGITGKYRKTLYEKDTVGESEYMNVREQISVGVIETECAVKSDAFKLLTGGYVEGESYDLIDAHCHAGVTGLNYKAYAGGNLGPIGANVGVDVSIGKAEVDVGAKIGVNENGVPVVDAGVELMVTAIEGEVTSTINLGIVEAESDIKVYIGSVGLEGGISYDGEKLNVKIGASLGIGCGVDVTIEPSGILKDAIDSFYEFKKEMDNVAKYGCGYLGHVFGFW